MSEPREQKLVDICFSVAMHIHTEKSFKGKSNEEVAKWVAEQLEGCGFKTIPMGASWGVLTNKQ